MILLVGLGNPGPQYERNRHTLGFMAVDEIVRRHSFGPERARFQGLISEGRLGDEKVMVLKPLTYMNESGRSVGEAARFYKIPLDNIIVFHDELDLALGKVKVKKGGGHAGHNGLRSIDAHIGNDYRRVRLGIGHPGLKSAVVGYVLKDFAKAEEDVIRKLVEAVADAAPKLAGGDDAGFLTRVALLLQPPKNKKKPAEAAQAPEAGPAVDKTAEGGKKTAIGDALSKLFGPKDNSSKKDPQNGL